VQPLKNFLALFRTRVHKNPPLVPILSQITAVHTILTHVSLSLSLSLKEEEEEEENSIA
jgi:hypothetical protein